MKPTDFYPSGAGGGEPVRLPKRKLPPMLDVALPLAAVGSGAMLFLAVPNIIEGNDWMSWVKAATLSASATGIAFVINKLAIERGAPLATTGYWGAGLTSIASVLAVGGGLFAATYSGLTFNDVAELKLQEHGTALSEHVGAKSSAASEAGRAGPALLAVIDDLAQKRDCELASSCMSGRGGGGRGPVTRALESLAGRAATIGQQITDGEVKRQTTIAGLNRQLTGYQQVLGDDATRIWDRRAKLQVIDAEIRQLAGALGEATPLALLGAYADELKSGVSIPGQPQASETLNAILAGHGQSLKAVLSSINDDGGAAPAFPKRTGVSDTFEYFGHFLPIAAITAVVELVFPLSLWIYTFCALSWEAFKNEQSRLNRQSRDPDDYPVRPPRRGSVADLTAKRRGRPPRRVNGNGQHPLT